MSFSMSTLSHSQKQPMTPTTTVFTMPSMEQQQEQHPEYEEFPEPSSSPTTAATSPSLPWFLDYWSATFFRTPAVVVDQLLCYSCHGNVQDQTLDDDDDDDYQYKGSHQQQRQQDIFRFDIPNDRSWKLKQVVASHDDSLFRDETTLLMGNNDNTHRNSRYPVKYPGIRKSSILKDDDDWNDGADSILDYDLDEDNQDDDSPREQADESSSDYYLTPCDSFDLICQTKSKASINNHNNNNNKQCIHRNVRQRLHVPSSPTTMTANGGEDAQTYTTVSLTQSFMKEFEDETSCSTSSEQDYDQEEMDDDNSTAMRNRTLYSELFRGVVVEEEEEEEEESTCSRLSRKRPAPHTTTNNNIKTVNDDEKEEEEEEEYEKDHTEPYRYLIRMRPRNYIHFNSDGNYNSMGGMEEEKSCDDDYHLPSHEQLKSDMSFREAFSIMPESMRGC